MSHACKLIAAVLLFLLACGHANAYTENCSGGHPGLVAGTTGVTPTLPSGLSNGDLVILAVSDALASTPAITFSGGTGTWNTALASTTVSGSSQMIVVSHIYQSGDTAPTFVVASGSNTQFVYNACGLMGFTRVDQVGSTRTATSATVSYPTETPSVGNEEALFIATMQGSAPTINSTSTPITCSQTTDQVQEETQLASSVSMSLYETNLGPCSPTALAAQSMTLAATTNSLGVTVLLTPSPLQSTNFISSSPLRNVRGAAYFLSTVPGSIDPAMFYPYDDVWAIYTSWKAVEPNNCDEYSFDYLDNLILLARQNAKRVALGIKTGYQTPCGGAGEAACGSFTDNSGMPAWAFTSTTCDGSHAMVQGTDYISSVWQKGSFGPPEGNVNFLMDPANSHYQAEWDRAISAFGARYGAIPNVVAVKVTSFAAYTVELSVNAGADGSTIACTGNSTQCTAICGSASCNVTISDGAQWLGLTPASGGTYSGSSFGTGDSTTCSGSNQPFLACDLERGHEHFEASWHTAFPNAALENALEGTTAPKSTVPACGGSCLANAGDTFVGDIFAHDKTNFTGVMQEENGSLGYGAFYGNCVPIGFFNNISQPALGAAYQTGTAEASVAGATCTSGGLYSTSATQCLTPSVYAALSQLQNPMIEFYVMDWDTAGVQPWIKLLHDVAWGN